MTRNAQVMEAEAAAAPADVPADVAADGVVIEGDRFVIGGVVFDRLGILKKDFISTNILVRERSTGIKYVVKHSYLNFPVGRQAAWFACWLSRREHAIYRKLQGVEGIPGVHPVRGRDFFLHEYIEGWPLSQCHDVPDGFFAALDAVMARVHDQGVAYVDSAKQSNVIITPDGRPFLIDFQISACLSTTGVFLGSLWNVFVEHMKYEDFYHLRKHKKALRRETMTDEDWRMVRRKSLPNRVFKYAFRLPWHAVKRRIWPKGSDEKRQRFRSKKT